MNENSNPPQEDETVTLSKAEHDELVKKLADESQAKTNLVEELTTERKKKQDSEAVAEDLKKKLEEKVEIPVEAGELTADKIAEIASKATQEVLNKNTETTVASNKEMALAKFKEKYKEFHTDNDEGGIKIASLERKLERFNMSSLKSVEDFISVFEDAYNLIGKTAIQDKPGTPIPADPSTDGPAPAEVTTDNLTPEELKVIDRAFDGDKERYIKIKAKRPDFVNTLIQGKHY